MKTVDPIRLAKELWPDVYFYKQQRQIIYSVWYNRQTIVPAGNMLGKDFVAGFIIPAFFLTRHPCRIVTTSAKDDHLRVLWGEIKWFINNCKIPLTVDKGGPLIVRDREIKKMYKGQKCPISYIAGMVANKDSIAAMQGHHVKNIGDGIPRTLFASDESSSVADEYFTMASTWANRMFIFGNPWECNNYFFKAIEGDPATNDPGGDIPGPRGTYIRKVIRITAEDSPNVRYARAQIKAGKEPDNRIIVPGVKSWEEYLENRKLWDKHKQTVSLDGEFYKGSEVLLFPRDALVRAMTAARRLAGRPRRAEAMGVDAAEGGDSTVWTVVDRLGVLEQLSLKTEDTADIPGQTLALMRKYNLSADRVFFDRGGGGKQIADQLRRRGYDVRTIGFGESASDIHQDRKTATVRNPVGKRVDLSESRYAYKNRRAELYGVASQLVCGEATFAIPPTCTELMRQLKVMPKKYDGEGRLYLPPKQAPHDGYTGKTLKQILGRSPDEADSFVLAVYGMLRRPVRIQAGAI